MLTQSYAGLGGRYTAAQVLAEWSSATAVEDWRFARCRYDGTFLSDLTPYVSAATPPTIEHDATRAAKRALKIRLLGSNPLNAFTDCIQPWYRLLMSDGGWAEWPMGMFLVNPPKSGINPELSWRDYDGFDLAQVVVDAKFTDSFGVAGGSTYRSGLSSILSSLAGNIVLSSILLGVDPATGADQLAKTLAAALGWQCGDSLLTAISDLLSALNCFPAWWDEWGQMRTSSVPDWNTVTPFYTFDTTQGAVIVQAPQQIDPDPSTACNQCRVIGEDPRQVAISAYYENDRPDSPTSVPNWRPILKVVRDSKIADVATAALVAKRTVQEGARIYTVLKLATMPWPWSQDSDVYQVTTQANDEPLSSLPYVEMKWTHTCAPGVATMHELTPIVAA